ncbi:site-specific DNA-methyltransferase [Latilactobacillus sakei]|uniref:site-specific DNA-methyltransferase n=2 Tax=Bacteria TaxID=2 RepID=UPI0020745EBE|nr:site-specific DNA-methyltransferase [Latilactobacillus sakei]USG08192.1 site-specific DNA-methyltransferase [Latilactobacillus sakei]USG11869.1 site-specific DNA-methyltransferase [Latilactobacillus sakei]
MSRAEQGLRANLEYNNGVKANTAFYDELKNKLPNFFTADKLDEFGAVKELGSFDLEKFKASLNENNINELTSGYQLDFIGKNYAKKQAGERPTTVIVPDNVHNEKAENKSSKNLFFSGDNLEVLRHLQQNYANSIDFIYIDPPYNTGSDGFVYPDNFEYSDGQLQDMFGLNSEELKRLKSIQGKSTHSAWLTFMYPRLYLAKKLLKDTGVIFVSIDDNEQANLKLLMDDVYGEGNFVAEVIIDATPKNDPMMIATSHEYMLTYVKNEPEARKQVWGSPHPLTDQIVRIANDYDNKEAETKLKDFYKKNNLTSNNISNYKFVDQYGVFRIGPLDDPQSRGPKDERINIKTGRPLKVPARGWRTNVETWNKWVSENLIYFPEEDSKLASKKTYLNKDKLDVGRSVIKIQTRATTNYLNSLFNVKNIFNNPKPINLIKQIISLMNNEEPIILDFFAGSSTTADAVMQLNAEDGGHRQFMMCTLPEPTFTTNSNGKEVPTKGGKAAYKAGFKSIDEISRERIIRASAKIKAENTNLSEDFDGGFKHYRVVPAKQETLDQLEFDDNLQLDMFDSMLDDFSSDHLGVTGQASGFDTILQTYLASDNYQFDVPIKMIDFGGIKVAYVNQQRIYIITDNWQSENTKALVNAIGTNQIAVQTIVVFGYPMAMESLRELKIALKQLENNVKVLVRY